jgi:EthD domain-containing protein
VPLICSLAPTPIVYKRRYLVRGGELTKEGGSVDFDVMTELGFPDRTAFLAWMAQLSGPGVGEQVAADEGKFLDRSRTRAYVIEEYVTSGE